MQGGVLEGKVDEVLLLDVVPLSLGVETKGGLFTKIIERNTTIPTKRSRVFTTAFDNQDFVGIHVLQGEREMVDDNISLANFNLSAYRRRRGACRRSRYRSKWTRTASARLGEGPRDREEAGDKRRHSGGLSDSEIQKIIEESRESSDADKRKRDLAVLKNEAEGLLYSVKKTLDSYSDKIDPELREHIEGSVRDMRESLESDDYAYVKDMLDRLKNASYKFAEVIYSRHESYSEAFNENE